MMDNMQGGGQGKTCTCIHHSIVPILITLLGLDFLLGALNVLTGDFVAITWPIVLTLIGLMKLASRRCTCC